MIPPRSRPSLRTLRRGFSLIELLLNLAIIGALVGIAVPLYQDFIYTAQRSKAGYDLEVIKGAISRFESKDGMFSGTSMKPLLGRHLSEIPVDPWGSQYFVEGNLGVIGTLGSDGAPYGDLSDQDITVHYKPYLIPIRVGYTGGFGVPSSDNVLTLRTNKVFGVVSGMEAQAANDVVLVRSVDEPPIPLSQLGFQYSPTDTKPGQGLLVLKCCSAPNPNVDPPGAPRFPIRAGDLVNLSGLVLSITEYPIFGGPLAEAADDFIYGTLPATSSLGGLVIERDS